MNPKPEEGGTVSKIVDRVITHNIKVTLGLRTARSVLKQVLAYGPTVIALQEFGNARNVLLTETGKLTRWAAARRWLGRTKPGTGIVWVRPMIVPSGPVGLDRARYGVRRCHGVVLHKASRVRPQPNHPKVIRPASIATVVVADDYALGGLTVVICYHLDSGVQDVHTGGYRTDAAALPDVARHKREVVELQKLIAYHEGKGRRVIALGDSNFEGLALNGLTSAFDGHRVTGGTEGARKIDDVFAVGRTSKVEVIPTASDHDAVLAVRDHTPKPVPVTPPTGIWLGPAAHISAGSNLPIWRIVLHTTITPCVAGGARAVAAYFREQASGGSAQLIVDPSEVVRVVRDDQIAWGAPAGDTRGLPANAHELHLELCDPLVDDKGRELPASRWADADHTAMLELAAEAVARWAIVHKIPITFLTVPELLAEDHGITGHAQISQAWHETDHWDPGKGFPWSHFLDLVHAHAAALQSGAAS